MYVLALGWFSTIAHASWVYLKRLVAIPRRRMLRIAHQAGPSCRVIVPPLQSTDLRFATRRGDRKIHNRLHGDLRTPIVGTGSPAPRAPLPDASPSSPR